MHPDYVPQLVALDPTRLSDDLLRALRPFYFSDRVEPAILREALAHMNGESPRVLFDLALRLHGGLPKRGGSSLLVMGADDDRIAIPDDVRATAAHHGVAAKILPGMGHMLMLEPDWREAADALAEWLADLR